ncbi:MAG: TonB family protein [Archangium sp.]|nr:TonB family protein [Archangium sp.]
MSQAADAGPPVTPSEGAPSEAADAGPVIEPPTAKCTGAPEYPPSERASGIQGTVALRITLDADAGVTARAVVSSPGPAFEAAALRSLDDCQLIPARVNGVPAPSIIELAIVFVPPVLPWTLEGEVVGAELGEPIAGANVSLGTKEVRTDAQGRFTLVFDTLPPGDPWVTVEKEGYALKGFPELFKSGQRTTVRYGLVKSRGFETRVEGSRLLASVPDADRTPQVSRFSLTRADIDRTPGALEDITRVVQQLPGVAADPDLLANFFVRGGGPDETIVFIDGVPLSNPYHLGGFASIINPLLIDSADFYAGAAPARYEPALSGVLDVRYVRGDVKKVKVIADVSMLTAKVRADVPLGLEGLSAVVSFRRSYFEAYFAVLKAFKLFGQNVVAPDITEAFVRVAYRRGKHLTLLTFTHASDGLNFVVKPGEEVLINFAGDLKLANNAQIVSLRHEVDLPGDSELTFTGAYLRDQNAFDVKGTIDLATQALRHDVVLRGDLKWVFSKQNRSSAGVQYAWRQVGLAGTVADSRSVAPWAREPIVESYRPALDIRPSLTRNLLSIYAEHTFVPIERLAFEGGLRAQYDVTNSVFTGSARLAGALTLPTLTVVKLSGGYVLQPLQTPLALDATYGNPLLQPERSAQLIGAIEQPLPFEALLRLEGWGKWMSNLVVNPDTALAVSEREAAGLPVYTNGGTGLAYGFDLMLFGRTRHFSYNLGVGALRADRQNPLGTRATSYAVQWEQQFTAAAGVSWSPNSKWLFTTRANFRTGRPYTPVDSFEFNGFDKTWLPQFGEPSSARYPFFFELSLRGERRFQWGPLSCAVYVEVLNVTNTQNVFSWVYGPGGKGVQPNQGRFTHLPIRPFLGLRGEY